METETREAKKKDGTVAYILEISEITSKVELFSEIKSFVTTINSEDDEKYASLVVAELDKEGKAYKYLSAECLQMNIVKVIKDIMEETYDFKTPISITKRKLKNVKNGEKKNQFTYSIKYIFENYAIPSGEYLYHEGEFIQLYGSIEDRIKNYNFKTKFSIKDFEKEEMYDGQKIIYKENLPSSLVEDTLKMLVSYEMGMSAKDAFITCVGGYAIKCETFGNELDIDFDIEGETPDETDRLFYEKHKDLQTDSFSELMYGINAFELFSKLQRGLSEQTIISACQLVGYKKWYDNTNKAEESGTTNSRTENVPNRKTIENIITMTNRLINFLDRERNLVAFDFPFADNEQSGYSEVISSGMGDCLTKYGIFIIDISNKIPTNETILKAITHYIMAKASKMPIFDEIVKVGIFNPRLNTCYYTFIENIPRSIIKEVKYDLICYR